MTYLAAAGATLRLYLAGRERRKVVVQDKVGIVGRCRAFDQQFVFRSAKRGCSERLGFTAGEQGRTMGAGQVVYFHGKTAHLIRLAAVEAYAFVEDHVAHGVVL